MAHLLMSGFRVNDLPGCVCGVPSGVSGHAIGKTGTADIRHGAAEKGFQARAVARKP
jgi:hypothetical protein